MFWVQWDPPRKKKKPLPTSQLGHHKNIGCIVLSRLLYADIYVYMEEEIYDQGKIKGIILKNPAQPLTYYV